jgi:hypothetical protein
MYDKKKFLMNFLPDSIEDLQLIHIDLEMTGLTICDILRNINRTFPQNSKDRYAMIDGKKLIAVVCKSDLLYPISGIILLVGGDLDIRIQSRNYVLISVNEKDITSEDKLNKINNDMMVYLAKMLMPHVKAFKEFCNRSLYNDYETLGE